MNEYDCGRCGTDLEDAKVPMDNLGDIRCPICGHKLPAATEAF